MASTRPLVLEAGFATGGALTGVLLAILLDVSLGGGFGMRGLGMPHAWQLWLGMAVAAAVLVGSLWGRPDRPRVFLLLTGLAAWSFLPYGHGSTGVPLADALRLAAAPLLLWGTLALPLSWMVRLAIGAVGVWLVAGPVSLASSYGAWSGVVLVLGLGTYLAGWTLRETGRPQLAVACLTGGLGLFAGLFIAPELLQYQDAASLAILVLGCAVAAAAIYGVRGSRRCARPGSGG